MEIVIDNEDFCIRLYRNVAYLKVIGMQDADSAEFFAKTIDEMLEKYPHKEFASLCDLTDLILSDPRVALQINKAIRKITETLEYKHNAVIVKPKFLQIIQAYIFSFYLRDTDLKTKIYKNQLDAICWLEDKGYCLKKIKEFLCVNCQ